MVEPISDDQWAAIDAAIVANRKIEAIKAIRDLAEVSLNDALAAFYGRYAFLRAEAPEQFEHSNQEYWTDFYTNGPQPSMAEPGTLPDWPDL